MTKETNYLYTISIVIPVFNSEQIVEKLMDEISSTLLEEGCSFETIFINDCSHDNSIQSLNAIFLKHQNISIIDLRKNSGQDNAIMAGLKHVSGKYIVVMDDDLQHHPKYIPMLLRAMNDEVDVCYVNFFTKKQKMFKNLGSSFVDLCANFLLKKPKNIYLSPYKIFNSQVAKEVVKYEGPYPYIDGLIFRVTKRITQIDREHSERLNGEGNYTLGKSIKVWAALATNFSILPLRISTFLGFFTAVIGFLLGVFYILSYLLDNQTPSGWSTLTVLILVFGGIQLIALGVIGEYLGRLFLLNNNEPQFVIKKIRSNRGS